MVNVFVTPALTVDDASLLATTVKSVVVKPCRPELKLYEASTVNGVPVEHVGVCPIELKQAINKEKVIKEKVKILLMTIKFKFKRFGKGSQEHWGRILDKVQ